MYSQSGDIPLSPGDIPGALSIRTLMDGVTDLGLNQKKLHVEVNYMVAHVIS